MVSSRCLGHPVGGQSGSFTRFQVPTIGKNNYYYNCRYNNNTSNSISEYTVDR